METFAAIIDAFGYAELASLLGKPEGTVSSWKTRNFIPSEVWISVVNEASRRELEGVTFELLARLETERHSAKRSAPRKPSAAKVAQ
ncbi:helix-turn-helix domain-containing protein [Microvirga antarctica]|uniref:helix-turn-helix domain-containing protein n=1 Tax=Microvirga antarctica TaxID=2819233 RepID=UPI001B3029F8|nr:helix-turn-helix domain-containing protein [Microvirga antarctica]